MDQKVNVLIEAKKRKESQLLLQKFPDRVPVIVETSVRVFVNSSEILKFLVPFNLTVSQFYWIVRKRMRINSNKSIFILVNRTLPKACTLLGELYCEHKSNDGFLYVYYCEENTFGN